MWEFPVIRVGAQPVNCQIQASHVDLNYLISIGIMYLKLSMHSRVGLIRYTGMSRVITRDIPTYLQCSAAYTTST